MLNPLTKITFEETTRIIYYQFAREPKLFMRIMEELMDNNGNFGDTIAPAWYNQYRDHLNGNRKNKIA